MRRRSLDIGGHCSCALSRIITARMANTQSAKKRVRASLRKRDRNRSTRSAVKTLVSRARRPALPDAASLTSEEVRRAISALDKAAEKGVLHANNASRRKAPAPRSIRSIDFPLPAGDYGGMRRGRLILSAACVVLLLAIAAAVITRSPARLA